MKAIINSEILGVSEYKRFLEKPYPNSDFSVGRKIDPTNIWLNLAMNLLLYDKIYISTVSFEEFMRLKEWLGPHNLMNLLYDGSINFLQTPFHWAYIQKWKKEAGTFSMNGIVMVSLADQSLETSNLPRSGKGPISQKDLGGWSSTDLEEAATYTLLHIHKWNPKKVSKVARLIAKNTTRLESDEFKRFITNKSESDLNTKEIREKLKLPKDLDIENVPDNSPEIRKIFQVILANQNLAITNNLPHADLLTEEFFLEALRDPLENSLRKNKLNKNTSDLFKLEKIPVPDIFKAGFSFTDIIKIRNSPEGKKFREWIHDNFDSGDDIQSAYVELLKKKPHFLFQFLSFVTPSIIGLGASALTQVPSQLITPVVGGVKEFAVKPFIEKFLVPNPPKVFIEKVKENIKEE